MTSINFTGLASGMDTNLIIENLMELERMPLKRLEDDKQFYQSRLSSLKTYHDKLSALNTSVDALSLSGSVRESQVSLSNSDYFSANISGAQEGTYSVTVEKLAQVQKSVSESVFASRTDKVFGTGELTLIVGETPHTISITENNDSIDSIMNAINEGTNVHGISASVIDSGNEGGNRYYLVLTGADSSMEFTLDSTGMAGGTETLSMAVTQTAQNAVAYIDGIQVIGKTNTIENAIHGVTLTLENVSPDNGSGDLKPTTMTISLNKNSVAGKIENFVKAYNDMVTFVAGETKVIGSGGALLTGDSMVSTAARRLQNMLGKQVEGTDTYSALTQLGLTTGKDGTISFDSTKLAKAVEDNFDDVTKLMAGDDGIFKQYRNYLNNLLSSSSGLYATRQENVKRITDRIDKDIGRMEARLEKREQILTKRFSAMENLVSVLNAQSDYIKQQMDMLSNMGGKKR